jgi:valyl-tRNA synthetase
LVTDYNVKNAVIYIQADKNHTLLKHEEGIILNLVKGLKTLHVLSSTETLEPGCALYAISEDINAHLLVKGHVDFAAEIEKFEGKLAKTVDARGVIVKKTMDAKYEEKVKLEVREADAMKIKGLDGEIGALGKTIENFKALAME